MLSSTEIRQCFIEYFKQKAHTEVSSSSLVPQNDPTLLFTNAGMVQFKEVFLGHEKPDYTRAVSSQRCVRAGGKHNDLENVGYTARHHTFFEMLGNFSFGDYFKREAIEYAWDFLTNVLKLPAEKLWVTVYKDDKEAEAIWLEELKIDPTRFSRCGEKDNFWSMGETGPCGPCTEIFYDHGPEVPGGPPGSPEEEGDRYVEIWNLVFMQYDRNVDGQLKPLPKPSVDTGMGLERLAAVMQGVHSNYDIDIFKNLIKIAGKIIGCSDLKSPSLNVIADHIRSCSFLILDGVIPSNEGRGYVLRRIIRRAVRHGHKLGMSEPFFYQLVDALTEQMGDAYPELSAKKDYLKETLQREEEQFAKTLTQGMAILEESIQRYAPKPIPGDVLFKLYDTYGFPIDLVADIGRERGIELDIAGFEQSMQKQRERARAANQFKMTDTLEIPAETKTHFCGYDSLWLDSAVSGLYLQGERVDVLKEGEEGVLLLLDSSPYYAESGGQVGDRGQITSDTGCFCVQDTQKQGDVILHLGFVEHGKVSVKQKVVAKVDEGSRQRTVINHSATHLLHAALREYLGVQVEQKGSLVSQERMRFDFSYPNPLTQKQLDIIEQRVNHEIRSNWPVTTALMSPKEAAADGAMALFGEKYGDTVRVLTMGDFSKELCGGTHAKRTGDIGLFKIISESGIAAGVRRIEAITGQAAIEWIEAQESTLKTVAEVLKSTPAQLHEKIIQLLEKNKQLEKDKELLQVKLAGSTGSSLLEQAQEIEGVKVLAAAIEGIDAKALRESADQLKEKLGDSVVVLATIQDKKISLVTSVSKQCVGRLHAGELMQYIAQQIGGKGGGRPDMAQGGGSNPDALPSALESVYQWVKERAKASEVI